MFICEQLYLLQFKIECMSWLYTWGWASPGHTWEAFCMTSPPASLKSKEIENLNWFCKASWQKALANINLWSLYTVNKYWNVPVCTNLTTVLVPCTAPKHLLVLSGHSFDGNKILPCWPRKHVAKRLPDTCEPLVNGHWLPELCAKPAMLHLGNVGLCPSHVWNTGYSIFANGLIKEKWKCMCSTSFKVTINSVKAQTETVVESYSSLITANLGNPMVFTGTILHKLARYIASTSSQPNTPSLYRCHFVRSQ